MLVIKRDNVHDRVVDNKGSATYFDSKYEILSLCPPLGVEVLEASDCQVVG